MKLDNKRTTWFVTRPQRDPQYFPVALEALQEATNNFKEKWNSNREVQKKYEEILVEKGLKRENISKDGSGGRTWTAMLRTYSIIYMSSDGYIIPTKVGLELLGGNKIFENLTKQLLTLQIPNAYFISAGFRPKFDENFRIRPIRFLIKLVCQNSLENYITKEEIIFFAMTAKKDSDLQEVTQNILDFRSSDASKKQEIKDNIGSLLDYRNRLDKNARTFEEANSDVASTFMKQAGYTELVEYKNSKLYISEGLSSIKNKLEEFDIRYPFNTRYEISEDRFGENAGLDVDSFKSRWTSNIPVASSTKKEELQIKSILSKFPNLISKSPEEILKVLSTVFPPKKTKEIYLKIMDRENKSYTINENFISSYLNQTNDLDFEKQTIQLFESFGFEAVYHPKSVLPDTKTNIDILIHLDDQNIAIIDAKNYKKKFILSANLANHMAVEYIPGYEGYENKKVKYFGYITASQIGGVSNLSKISKKAKLFDQNLNVSGTIISAVALIGLLDYCIDNDLPINKRKQLVLQLFNDNVAYETYSYLAEKLKLL